MKALLIKDVPNVGRAGEIVSLDEHKYRDEFQPFGLAVEATPLNIQLWSLKRDIAGAENQTSTKEVVARQVRSSNPHAGEVRPGVVPAIDLNRIQPPERELLETLSKVWLITWVKFQNFKGSNYLYVFAKPTSQLRDMFHLGREVLVLFELQDKHSARALDFVDRLMIEFSNRLDRLCMVLVSRDEDIQDEIKRFTNETPESRVVIPFSYSELAGATAEVVTQRFKDHFFTRDLFSFSSPLKHDTYFFGRAEVVSHYYDKYRSGENSGLFGLRKTGKTSVLYALRRFLTLRNEPFVLIDCHDPAVHSRRWNEALAFVIRLAADQLSVPKSSLHKPEEYSEKDASVCFEEDLRVVFRQQGSRRVLLAFDEIESITYGLSPSHHWARDNDFLFFWQSIRAIFQRNDGLFSLIVTGVNPFCAEIPSVLGVDNPIYRFIVPRYLSLFGIQQVREMVSNIGKYMGLNFEEEIFTYLTEDYGGHPFLIRNVCSIVHRHVVESRPAVISKLKYKSLKDTFTRELFDYINQILVVLKERYPKEYQLLEFLADGRNEEFARIVAVSKIIIEHLVGYGLVRENSGRYFFTIQAVEEFVRTNSSLERVLNTKEEKWSEVTILRNNLEQLLRRAVKLVVKGRYGASDGREKVLAMLEERRRERLSLKDFNALMDGNVSEIYFDDLRKIILKYWGDFEVIFKKDKGKFDTYMQFINSNRIDAHAKDISDDDLGVLLIGLRWLTAAVKDYMD
jgi:hypothetical protein